jgi:hypothetical protein
MQFRFKNKLKLLALLLLFLGVFENIKTKLVNLKLRFTCSVYMFYLKIHVNPKYRVLAVFISLGYSITLSILYQYLAIHGLSMFDTTQITPNNENPIINNENPIIKNEKDVKIENSTPKKNENVNTPENTENINKPKIKFPKPCKVTFGLEDPRINEMKPKTEFSRDQDMPVKKDTPDAPSVRNLPVKKDTPDAPSVRNLPQIVNRETNISPNANSDKVNSVNVGQVNLNKVTEMSLMYPEISLKGPIMSKNVSSGTQAPIYENTGIINNNPENVSQAPQPLFR